MKYLVINNNKNGLYSYSDMYKLFTDREDAIQHFKAIGAQMAFGLGLSNKPGIASIEKCGQLDITFLPIEEQ